MRKTILMLINGFGTLKKGSVEVYSPSLMPNMDKMTKEQMFASLVATAGDYNLGYKNFSMQEVSASKEDKIDNLIYDRLLSKDVTLNEIKDKLTTNNKLHIFYNFSNGYKLHQLKEIVKILNANKDKQVFIHLVMCATSVNDYDTIMKVINKLAFEMNDYSKLGFIVGKNKVNGDDVLRTIYKEFGEHWNESTKKFEVFIKDVVNPDDANVFYINNGFSLNKEDIIFFANFEDINIDKLYTEFTNFGVNMYSLYKINGGIKHAFEREEKEISGINKLLEDFNINLLVMTDEARMNDINFYLNGMKKGLCKKITYARLNTNLLSSKENVVNLVENNSYNGIIIDFHIGNCNSTDEIKSILKKIDALIKPISEASKERDYTFIISSLYGMHKQILDGVVAKTIDFSGKVPCIYQNNEFVKSDYALNPGNTYALLQTFLTNINDEVKSNKLVRKLNGFDKLVKKK